MFASLTRATRPAVAAAAAGVPRRFARDMTKPIWVPFKVNGGGLGAQVKFHARQHEVCVDEPVHLGGHDKGPNPIELCMSSLAACKSATLAHVAKQMGVNVSHVDFPVVEGVIDGRGFQGMEGVYAGIQRVTLELDVTAEGMTQEQLNELKRRIGVQCPVAATFKRAGTEMDVTVRCGGMVAE